MLVAFKIEDQERTLANRQPALFDADEQLIEVQSVGRDVTELVATAACS